MNHGKIMKINSKSWWFPCVLTLLIASGCASLPDNTERTPSYTIEDTSNTRLGRELEPLVSQHPGESGFHPLIDGIDAFAARLVLVSKANKSLDLQYYIWHDDTTGKFLHNQLLNAADRGVRV